MKLSLGMKSLILFSLSVIALVVLTLFESSLVGVSITIERMIGFVFLVVPGIIGFVFGVLGIVRRESNVWIAYLGVLLNALFVLFHLLVLSFAG